MGRVWERHLHAKCLPPILVLAFLVSISFRQRLRDTVLLKTCSPPPVCGLCRPQCPSVSEGGVWMLRCDNFLVLPASHLLDHEGPLTLAADKPTSSHMAAASHSRTATTSCTNSSSFLPSWCPGSVPSGRVLSAASASLLPGGCRARRRHAGQAEGPLHVLLQLT